LRCSVRGAVSEFWGDDLCGRSALVGCSLGARDAPESLPYMRSGDALRALNATGAGKIKHIVYIVQGNRSFNNLFYGYPGAYTLRRDFALEPGLVALAGMIARPAAIAAMAVADRLALARVATNLPPSRVYRALRDSPRHGGHSRACLKAPLGDVTALRATS
jgi:hypothetical protein